MPMAKMYQSTSIPISLHIQVHPVAGMLRNCREVSVTLWQYKQFIALCTPDGALY